MSKVANMLNMLQILKDGKIHSIQTISEQLEVSKRMIRQYKLELEQVGIYIVSITGKYGGYLLENTNIEKSIDISIQQTGEKFNDIRKAIKNKNKVEIEFFSIHSGITQRIIHPAEVFSYKNDWYVAAFCEKRQEIRLFKIEDIRKYKVLEEKYVEKNIIKKEL